MRTMEEFDRSYDKDAAFRMLGATIPGFRQDVADAIFDGLDAVIADLETRVGQVSRFEVMATLKAIQMRAGRAWVDDVLAASGTPALP